MADGTGIEWADATWQPITGCSVVSPGCTNCYAMRLAGTRLCDHPSRLGLTRASRAGPVWTGEVRFNEQWLEQPLHWRKPRRIFVCAHGDLFHEAVPDEWIRTVFDVMFWSNQHTFVVLTKRAQRMREFCSGKAPLRNVMLGVSVEDQPRADERIPELMATPAAKRLISAEPLLGPIDLSHGGSKGLPIYWEGTEADGPLPAYTLAADGFRRGPDLKRRGWARHSLTGQELDWVVVGGESGPGARPMHVSWARSLRDQCQAAGTPFFFKQHGEWQSVADLPDGGERFERLGKKAAGRLLDGREHSAFPA